MRPSRSIFLGAIAVALTASVARAQVTPPIKVEKDRPAGHSMEHMSGWKELDAYHMVMMGVWHPAKEKSDLQPIRAQADKLASAAETWSKADVPKACDSPENRATIARINTDSRALAALVKTGSDAEVLTALRELHERFEQVNRSCKVKPAP